MPSWNPGWLWNVPSSGGLIVPTWGRLRRHYVSAERWATREGVSGAIILLYRGKRNTSVVWLPDYRKTRMGQIWASEGARWRVLRRIR